MFEFVHRVDALRGDVQVVRTDHARLRAALFLDGRERFWSGDRVVRLAQCPAPAGKCDSAFVFHVGFCGSTLLARMLDDAGAVFVLKEPQALSDLGSQAALIADPGSALDRVAAALAASKPEGEMLVIKPSNWANGLAPMLAERGHVRQALFISMEQRAFLRACFRGGRDRLAYCLRLAAVLAPYCDGSTEPLQRAIALTGDELDRAAAIVALAHAQQEVLFRVAASRLDAAKTVRIDFAEISADPLAALQRAVALLGLPAATDGANPSSVARLHGKEHDQAFSLERERQANLEIEHHHSARFDRALDWLAREWPEAAQITERR